MIAKTTILILTLHATITAAAWLGIPRAIPKYYFQDIPAEVMKEIMDEMLAAKPEPDIDEMLEALDWFNRSTVARTIPAWHESVREFLSDVRYAYK